jgi:hypothetical protein
MHDSAPRDFKPVKKILYNKHPRRKNNEVVAAMYSMYESGKPLAKIARVYRKTRQAVYDVFRSRGYELRSKRLDGLQILDGMIFTRHIQWPTNFYAYLCVGETQWPSAKTVRSHYKDLNRENNIIENLELLTIEEISSKHNSHYNQFTSPRSLQHKKGPSREA